MEIAGIVLFLVIGLILLAHEDKGIRKSRP